MERRTLLKGIVGLAASLLGLGNTGESKEIIFYWTKAGVELKLQSLGEVRTLTSNGISSGPIGYLPYYLLSHETGVKQSAKEGSRRRYLVNDGGQLA